MSGERVAVQARLGGTQTRHHWVRQHRLRHAHRLPMHHHGGMDVRPLLRQCFDILYYLLLLSILFR